MTQPRDSGSALSTSWKLADVQRELIPQGMLEGYQQAFSGTPVRFSLYGEPFESKHPYFKDYPGLQAFVDFFITVHGIYIGFLIVEPQFRGSGLARQLVQAIYDAYPDQKVIWGKLMEPQMEHLKDQFQQEFPDRTATTDPYPVLPPKHPLRPLLEAYDKAGEQIGGWTCDGGAAALSNMLDQAGIPHTPEVGLYYWGQDNPERMRQKYELMEGDPSDVDLQNDYWDDEHHHWIETLDGYLIDPNGEIRGEPRVQKSPGGTHGRYDPREDREVAQWSPWFNEPSDEDWESGHYDSLYELPTKPSYEHELPAWKQIFGAADDFTEFFEDASRGLYAPSSPYVPSYSNPDHAQFDQTWRGFSGNFDQHIDSSIPGYRENQSAKGNAIVKTFGPNAQMIDLGSSEGSFGKAVTQSGGPQSHNLDPNDAMEEHFNSTPIPEGAQFVKGYFGEYNPGPVYDVVHESMLFQFIGPEREKHIELAKSLLKPGGLFITDEKVITDNFEQNEKTKDEWKSQFYSPEQMQQKQDVVKVQRTGMADRSGIPEIDNLIEEFLRTPQGEWTTDVDPIDALRDPVRAHGMCQMVTEQFVEFAKSRGFKAYSTDTDLDEMGYSPTGEPQGEIGFDENDEMQYGFYPEHTVATIYVDDPRYPFGRQVIIDFTATQYGYTDHPKVSGMIDNMVHVDELERALGEKFNYIQKYWESGNFVGYAASDDPNVVQRFIANLGARTAKVGKILQTSQIKRLTDEIESYARSLGKAIDWDESLGFYTGESRAYYGPHTLWLPLIQHDVDYLVCLHEIGHLILDIHVEGWGTDEMDLNAAEIEAAVWKWAIENSSIPVTPEMLNNAKEGLAAYEREKGIPITRPYHEWFQRYEPRTADYNGWTNWETWNTKLMMDNERETYDGSRELVEKYEHDMEKGVTALENWTIQNILGPSNAQAIEDAQEWNDIPEDERVDPHYEELKEKSEEAADFVDAIGFGKDVSDVDPTIVDPNLVNWIEIWNSIFEEVQENRAYEEEKRQNPPKVKPLGPAKFEVGQRVVIVTPSNDGRAMPGTFGTITDMSSWQNSFGDTGRIYMVKNDSDGRVTKEYEGGLRSFDEPHESGLYVGAQVGYQGIKCKIIDGPYEDSGLGGRAWRIAPLQVTRGTGQWYAKNALESELIPLEGPLDPQDTQPGDFTLPENWSKIVHYER